MKFLISVILFFTGIVVSAQPPAEVFIKNTVPTGPPPVCPVGTTNVFFTDIASTDTFTRYSGGTDRWNENSGGQIVSNIPRPDVYYRRFFVSDLFNSDGTHKLNGKFRTKMTDAANANQLFGFRMATLYPDPDLGGFHDVYTYSGFFSMYPQTWHTAMQAESSIDNRDFNDGQSWIAGYNGNSFKNLYAAAWVTIDSWFDTAFIRPTSGPKAGQSIPAKDMIAYIDISGVGSYGEMHHCCLGNGLDNLHDSPNDANGWRYVDEDDDANPANWKQGRVASTATWKFLIDAQVDVLNWAHWVAVINIMDGKRFQNTEIPVEVGIYVLTKTNLVGKVGLRRDQFGNDDSYYHQILEQNTMVFGGVRADTAIMNRYKYAYFVGEPQGGPANCGGSNMGCAAIQVRLYHMYSFGNGNYGGTPTGAGADSVRLAARLAGARIKLTGGSMSSTLQGNCSFNMTLNWQNVGFSTVQREWTTTLQLRRTSDDAIVWTSNATFTVKGLIPAITSTTMNENFLLPGSVPAGNYRMVLKIIDPTGYLPALSLGTQGREIFYLGATGIETSASGVYQIRSNITVLPAS